MVNSTRSTFMINGAFNYFAFYSYRGNFLIGSKHNKLLEFPISHSAYVYRINGNHIFHYKFMWMDYIKKINFLKKLYASNSDLWFITNRYEYLGILDDHARESKAKIFHYNARRLFQEGYVGVPETLNFRMKLMGINNTAGFKNYHNSTDKYYFLINNERKDKLFLDEMAEDGYNNEPRLCISTANTNSLHINTFFYGLFGNNVPMSSKFFYFSLLKRCSGTIFHNDVFVRSKSKFSNFSNHTYQRRDHISGLSTSFGPSPLFLGSTYAASKTIFGDISIFTLRFNHIHNVFVLKKMFKYFRATGAAAKEVDLLWKSGVYNNSVKWPHA